MGRVLGDDSEVESKPGDTLVTSIDAKVQGVVERQLASTIKTARQTYDTVTHKNYVADSGAVVVMEAKTGRIVSLASQPTYDPSVWVGGISQQPAGAALLREGRHPAAGPGHPGPVRARLDVEADHDGRRAEQRLLAEHQAGLLVELPGRQPAVQELRVRVLRLHRLRARRCSSPATRSSTGWATTSGRSSAPTRPTSTPRTRWSSRRRVRLRQRDRRRPARRGQRPDRRPALEARLLQGDEELLLRHRPQAERTPATSCASSPTSSASRATTTGPATR